MLCIRAFLFLAAFLVSMPIAAQPLPAGDVNAARVGAAPAVEAILDGASGSGVLRSFAATPLTLSTPDFPTATVGLVRGQLEAAPQRQLTLTTLYASFATLQLLDVHSTRRALAMRFANGTVSEWPITVCQRRF